MNSDFVTRLFAASLEEALKRSEPIACEDCAEISGGKHPAWHLGHLVVGADFAAGFCGGQRQHEKLDALFAPGTEPEANRGKYPSKAELISLLVAEHARVTDLFTQLDADALELPLPMEEYRSFFPRVGDAVVYLLAYHEPYHNGQLQQWCLATGRTPAKAEA